MRISAAIYGKGIVPYQPSSPRVLSTWLTWFQNNPIPNRRNQVRNFRPNQLRIEPVRAETPKLLVGDRKQRRRQSLHRGQRHRPPARPSATKSARKRLGRSPQLQVRLSVLAMGNIPGRVGLGGFFRVVGLSFPGRRRAAGCGKRLNGTSRVPKY